MAHALLKKQAIPDECISQQKLIEITIWKKATIPRITAETIATNNTITGQTEYTHIGYKSK